jgi:hypothetical protein
MIDNPELAPCFQGVVPALLSTCSADGIPNVAYLSQVHYLDKKHVALSRQFFNKTFQNVLENPYATVELMDPLTLQGYRLKLKFLRSEIEGALFNSMSARIDAIATLTGMAGVFKLIGADIYEVLALETIEGYKEDGPEVTCTEDQIAPGPMTELRGLQVLSDRINRSRDLEEMLSITLGTLHELFGFAHSMVLVPEDDKLYAICTYGYDERGVGAEVPFGLGVIGTVARQKKMLSIAVAAELRYSRAIRKQLAERGGKLLEPEIILPGLPDAASEMALPLLVQDRLIGVIGIESVNPCAFRLWHEAFLTIIANQIAMGMDRFLREEEDQRPEPEEIKPAPTEHPSATRRVFQFFTNDDCIFVDGEYLIRNVPAKILWKLLLAHREEGRVQFSNRELRLDESLGLPALKDNLESRLILLKKRLAEKCPEVRLVPTARGRFALEINADLELVEKASA